MKALVAHGPKDLRLEDREEETLGPGQVRIAMASGGICGSDLHYYNHGGFGSIRLREPMILGHEVAGHVVEVGPGVDGLQVGQLVAVSPSRPCGTCAYCLDGLPMHCLNMRFYGSAMPFPHIQGAFAETLVADATQCVPADGLTSSQAAMAEPLAVCLHAVSQAGSLLGKQVLVTGCGPIGCLMILVARRAGAASIIATDLTPFTLDMAQRAGADEVLNLAEDHDALQRFQTDKGQCDVAFECAGAPAALASAVACLRPRGVLVQVGLGGDMSVPLQAITAKELMVKGSFRFHAEFAVGVQMMQQGLIQVDDLITHHYPLSDAVAAFEAASDRTSAMKVQLRFS